MGDDDSNGGSNDRIKDSAQQIWLAGLGAFAKMQEEGSKAFEALVKDGAGMQKKTQQAAEETLAQAQARMAGFASEFGTKAAGGWGKLENIFEDRVARALEKLGMPSADEVAALKARVDALEAQLKATKATPAARKAPTPRKSSSRTPAPSTTLAKPSARTSSRGKRP
ncbi:MAG: poly(hydroxyalkanoate) granule-associated protein [Comamonadaceae bacterium]|nr:MAG: poly(hydroxyalkanoate) granule-associated protein [Comamonadaceae bacterium]